MISTKKVLISIIIFNFYTFAQSGGPDGELSASLRYLSQRYTMPTAQTKGILNDIGTEELAHLEMVGAIVYQLTRDLDSKIVKESGFGDYFINHSTGVYPANSNGSPFNAFCLAVSGDPITDLNEDLAAEQKARATYDNILRLSDDPDVNDVIKFLRAREVVHYQRFGEALRLLEEDLRPKKTGVGMKDCDNK
ncbi:manganese catalase family protein [Qingrenia yutianensis]|uniref:Manganese catalase family protein n=1 Tax=Qingrenia yutianensis TaxID=2763676 RepID=A0A926ITV0_9FIRM|nr:manganese catalase family protein [Qingrenia yutianensis]